MKIFPPRPLLAAIVLGCGCVPSPLVQSVLAQAPATGVDSRAQAKVQARQSSLSQAAQKFATGNAADGERAVFAGIEQRAGTPGWHEEAGQRLYGLAIRLRSARQTGPALNAADSAIRQFDQAVTLALARNNSALAARVHEQAGALYEHFHGDYRTAATRLQESVRLDPASKTNRRSAERVTQIMADLIRKSAGK